MKQVRKRDRERVGESGREEEKVGEREKKWERARKGGREDEKERKRERKRERKIADSKDVSFTQLIMKERKATKKVLPKKGWRKYLKSWEMNSE